MVSKQQRFLERCASYISKLEDEGVDPVIVAALRSLLHSNRTLRGQVRSLLEEAQRESANVSPS